MDIQFYGANCLTFTTKQGRIVLDDNLAELGGKSPAKAGDIAIFTGAHGVLAQKPKIVIDQPGEFDVSGVSVYGIAARAHMDEASQKSATMYKFIFDELRVLVTGHIYPELTDRQLEQIGMIDVMIVPVGGNGYTLDGIGAAKLVKKVEPKLVIPTHYENTKLNFPVPQQPLETAIKALAMEPKEPTAKLRIKPADLTDVMQLVVIEQS
jgi:L-ascorbate metabolism protein UlaG (beta-lactamase superfamily)